MQAGRLERSATDTHTDTRKSTPQPQPTPAERDVVAAVGGHLRGAYAQYIIDPDTNDVVVRVRDVATDALLSETPTPEIQALNRRYREYAATMARRSIATRSETNV